MLSRLISTLTLFLSSILSVFFTAAVLGAQWRLSALGDSVLLVFELLLTVITLGLATWLIQRADTLAQQVGTVRRGSAQEAQADRVLARFAAAQKLLEQLGLLFLLPALAGFILLDSYLAMLLHGALLALGISVAIMLSHYLDKQRTARGYTLDFGRRVP
ncbi:hypothetical protein [Enterobacter sp. Bisph1]|uniref:hypothetical protein n=1 Tax=Enterobacter sp. Bisph1 TaxID=1274399 RepID=UPI00057BECD3|nr:hypothetical protein [Enterobacter sp. Bisph1]